MRYALEFTASATREFRDLDKQLQRRITEKVTALCKDPFPTGSKKLKAQPDHFRIRIADYRVIYRVDGKRVVILIVRIGHRREVYR